MPWQQTDAMEQRLRFVSLALRGGNFSQLCREFGVSRKTGYKWLRRYRKNSRFSEVVERSRRPLTSPARTPVEIERKVLDKHALWGDGARKIGHWLEAEGVHIHERTIHRILKRNGCVRDRISNSTATGSFQRDTPNELWQMDFKGYYRVREGRCVPLTILDDHSRFNIGLHALQGEKLQPVKDFLVRTFREYGVPRQMLMDHGVPWWDSQNARGLTRLSVWLICQGVQLCFSSVNHPQTQGKVERFHRSLDRAVRHRGLPGKFGQWQPLLDEYRHFYNFTRPHESLDMATPSDHYKRSVREYRENPPEWEYPEYMKRCHVNDSGLICWKRQFFVSEALAGQLVGVHELAGENKLLVCYRHMYIREVDLDTRTTRALLQPAPRE
jgi:transposase InsO family protein